MKYLCPFCTAPGECNYCDGSGFLSEKEVIRLSQGELDELLAFIWSKKGTSNKIVAEIYKTCPEENQDSVPYKFLEEILNRLQPFEKFPYSVNIIPEDDSIKEKPMNYEKMWKTLKKAYYALMEFQGKDSYVTMNSVIEKMKFIEEHLVMEDTSNEKEKAIQDIEGLYPPDASNEDTAEIGRQLLQQAKNEVYDWRDLPEKVLVRFALLCKERENLS